MAGNNEALATTSTAMHWDRCVNLRELPPRRHIHARSHAQLQQPPLELAHAQARKASKPMTLNICQCSTKPLVPMCASACVPPS